MKIRELFVKLGVEADSDELKNFDNALENAKDSVKDLLSWAGKSAAVFAGMFGGMAALSKVHGEFAEEAVRNADAFRMTTDSYQELRFAFQSLNASSDDLHDVLQSTQTAVYRAGLGATTYKDAIDALGLSHEQLAGQAPDQTFYKIVDAARAARDAGEDVSGALQSFFGDDLSRRILPGIMSATGSFEQFRMMAKTSSLVIEEDLLEKASDAQMQFRAFGATMTGLSRIAGIRLAPAFGRLAQHIMSAVAAFSKYFEGTFAKISGVLESEFEKISRYFSALNATITQYAGGWSTVFGVILAGFAAINALLGANALIGAFGAVKVLIAATAKVVGGSLLVALFKVIAIAALVAAAFIAVVLVVEDLVAYFNGVDSVTGRFIQKLREASSSMKNGLGKAVEFVVKLVGSFFRVMIGSFGFLFETLKELGGTFIEIFRRAAPYIGGVIVAALLLVMGAVITIVLMVVTLLKVLNFVLRAVIAVRDIFVELSVALWDGIITGIKAIADGWEDVKRGVAGSFDKVENAIERMKAGIQDMIDKVKSIPGMNILGTAGRGISRGFSGAREALGRTFTRRNTQNTQNSQSVDASNMRVEVNVADSSEAPGAVGEAVGKSLQDTFGTFLGSQYALGG